MIRASYAIHLHKRELPLLLKIRQFFESSGNVGSYGAQTSSEYRISGISDLNRYILPHFDNNQWIHLKSGKFYIGSAFDLSKRLNNYYKRSNLTRNSNSCIFNAILNHGYSSFSITIMEYIEISNLTKAEARKLILEREQFFIDTLNPTYYILKIAGSLLGFKLSDESKLKISLSKVNKKLSSETKALMSLAKHKKVFVYTLESDSKGLILHKSFNSCIEATKFLDCSTRTSPS